MWLVRHCDATLRLLGYSVMSCSVGAGNWFGSNGYSSAKQSYKRADVVLPGHLGPGRHLFLDTAVTCPAIGGALNAQPSSATAIGVAASLRAAKKVAKYQPLAEGVSSKFTPAVVERFGACGDRLAGFIGMISGSGDRDVCDDDFVFSTSSRTTYSATTIVFAAVIADASMLHDVLEHDGYRRALPGDDPDAPPRRTPPRPRVPRALVFPVSDVPGAVPRPALPQPRVLGIPGTFVSPVPPARPAAGHV